MTAKVDARVDVKLGARSYPILIGSGLLASAADHLLEAFPKARFAIVADEAVRSYADVLQGGLSGRGCSSASRFSCPRAKAPKAFPGLSACAAPFSTAGSSAIMPSSRWAAA